MGRGRDGVGFLHPTEVLNTDYKQALKSHVCILNSLEKPLRYYTKQIESKSK